MKIVKKSQTKEFKNSPVCLAKKYPLHDKEINGAVIEILDGNFTLFSSVCQQAR